VFEACNITGASVEASMRQSFETFAVKLCENNNSWLRREENN